jgi:hypothetical protein
MIGAIHARAKAVIDAGTYSNLIIPGTSPSFTNTVGGTGGIVSLNPVYEFGYKFLRKDENTINVFSRTGEDGDQQTTGLGGIIVRTFDQLSKVMLADRVEIYNDPTYCVFEYLPYSTGSEIWIYTHERLRSDPNNTALARTCLIKSTDGLVGRTFAAPVVQSAWNDYIVPLKILPDSSGQNYLYVGKGSPAGIRRCTVAVDGTLGAISAALISASGLTEGYIISVSPGTFLGVFRLDGGGFLQQASSTDYGATWTALSSTGIGAAASAKITPTLMRCLNRPGNLITVFNDRGNGNRDLGSSGNPIASALAGTWVATNFIGSPATQGNGGGFPLNVNNQEYLYVIARQTGSPVVTDMIYWVIKDRYSTKVQNVAGWE